MKNLSTTYRESLHRLISLPTPRPISIASINPTILKRGFLGPALPGLFDVPIVFHELQKTASNIPTEQASTTIEAILNLEDLTEAIEEIKDEATLWVLFRSYAYLEAFYLSTFNDGEASPTRLPASLSNPLEFFANHFGTVPGMNYHLCVTANEDQKGEDLALRFIDPSSLEKPSSESGFFRLHLDIEKHSPELVRTMVDLAKAVDAKSEENVAQLLTLFGNLLKQINLIRAHMRQRVDIDDFNTRFRKYFGSKDNIVFEGSGESRSLTGASGAASPTIDAFTRFFGFEKESKASEGKPLSGALQRSRAAIPTEFTDANILLTNLIHGNDNFGDLLTKSPQVLGAYIKGFCHYLDFMLGHYRMLKTYLGMKEQPKDDNTPTESKKGTGGAHPFDIKYRLQEMMDTLDVLTGRYSDMIDPSEEEPSEVLGAVNRIRSKFQEIAGQFLHTQKAVPPTSQNSPNDSQEDFSADHSTDESSDGSSGEEPDIKKPRKSVPFGNKSGDLGAENSVQPDNGPQGEASN